MAHTMGEPTLIPWKTLMNSVLIIDDDPDYRKLTGELLQLKGWKVLLAGEGDEGIRLAKAQRPQAVICDLLMPRCNGFQV
jgi:CheY-like chemotaxis protein